MRFVTYWPKEFLLAIKLRHTDWFKVAKVAQELYHPFQENDIAKIVVDIARRLDITLMFLTNYEASIRCVGTNEIKHFGRLDDIGHLVDWKIIVLRIINFLITKAWS